MDRNEGHAFIYKVKRRKVQLVVRVRASRMLSSKTTVECNNFVFSLVWTAAVFDLKYFETVCGCFITKIKR